MKEDVEGKAKTFDTDGTIKRLVDEALAKLRSFRKQYPFAEDPTTIDQLMPNDILKKDTGGMGDFFRYIEHQLKPLGHLEIKGTTVYRNIRAQLEDFKELLRIVVDNNKSIAEKIDAPWKEISRLGGDSHVAKKIIFCFNYETGQVVPIFKTEHLEYFLQTVNETTSFPEQYESMSLGKKYEFLTDELLKAKDTSNVTRSWEITYFCTFLYETYPPPKIITQTERKNLQAKAKLEQQQLFSDFVNLLNELRRKNRISAEERRTYQERWEKNPDERKTLTSKLFSL